MIPTLTSISSLIVLNWFQHMEPFDRIEDPLLDGSDEDDENNDDFHRFEDRPAQVYDAIFAAMLFVIVFFSLILYVVVYHMIYFDDETDD